MPAPFDFSTTLTEIAGLRITDLARRFGTPTYVYDAELIELRLADLAPFDVVRFAQKACSNLAILDLVRRQGGLVDTVSAGEIHRALAAGYSPQGDPPPIVFTADLFDRQALDLVCEHKIHVNCGSPDMISQLGERMPGAEITLRINPGFGHGHSQKTNTGGPQSKHGIWHEQIEDCQRRAAEHNLRITGVHMHIGSGTDMKHLSQVGSALEKVAVQLGPSITSVSAGGGLTVPYKEDESPVDISAYYKTWDATRKSLEKEFGHPISLEIEPGRYLTAESGTLITEIRTVKTIGENTFYLVDAGFNNLARPILYGAYHPMAIVPADGDSDGGDSDRGDSTNRPLQEVVVGGPLCESGDIFTQEAGGYVSHRLLPEAHVGDLLAIRCAGAYGFVMSSNYNSREMAAEVLLRGGQAHLIRSRQTFDDLIRGEVIPKEK